MNVQEDLNRLAAYLARRDVERLSEAPADLMILLGSAVLLTLDVAADALGSGAVKSLLISGGIGHSTPELYANVRRRQEWADMRLEGRPESEVLGEILVERYGIPPEKISLETVSTNCGGNAWESKRVLEELGLKPRAVVLVQDPTMQLRTHASFDRAWRGEPAPRFVSFAPFVPRVEGETIFPEDQWSFERFVRMLLGELPRLADRPGGYGPRGSDFIEHVDVPEELWENHARVSEAFPEWAGR
jgi:hypothetical protein